MSGESKRDASLDLQRAFLIVLVVYGHVLQCYVPNGWFTVRCRCIYAFHMAAFMLLSGYVGFAKPMTLKDCRKKFMRLIVPFFAWWFSSALIRIFPDKGVTGVIASFVRLLHAPDTGFWFFWVLGCLVVWLFSVQKMASRLKISEYVVAIAVWMVAFCVDRVVSFKFFGLGMMVHYFIFFYLGYELRKREAKISTWLYKLRCLSAVWFIFLFCFIASLYQAPFKRYILLVAALFGSLGLFVTFKCIRLPEIITCAGKVVGQNTMGIYVVHSYLCLFLATVPYVPFSGEVVCVLLLLVFLGITFVLKRIPYVRYLFLGIKNA